MCTQECLLGARLPRKVDLGIDTSTIYDLGVGLPNSKGRSHYRKHYGQEGASGDR